jgi:hypothetical protein
MRITTMIVRCGVLKKLKRSSTVKKSTALYATTKCTKFSMCLIRTNLNQSIMCHTHVSRVNKAESVLQYAYFIYMHTWRSNQENYNF